MKLRKNIIITNVACEQIARTINAALAGPKNLVDPLMDEDGQPVYDDAGQPVYPDEAQLFWVLAIDTKGNPILSQVGWAESLEAASVSASGAVAWRWGEGGATPAHVRQEFLTMFFEDENCEGEFLDIDNRNDATLSAMLEIEETEEEEQERQVREAAIAAQLEL